MKASQPTDLGRDLVRFFEDYLAAQRGMSPHSIRSYRDALLLLLQFSARDARRRVDQLQITDLTGERVARFLQFLERDRKNAIATRNARLGAIHVFARFLATQRPEHLASLQRVIGLPFKRGARESPIEYLDTAEIDALLKSIDTTTPAGRRDYALFALMFNTGGRVQEILNLRRRDVRLEAPYQVRLHGKGNKVRFCPIWPAVARLTRDLIAASGASKIDPAEALLFTNARGQPLWGSIGNYERARTGFRQPSLLPWHTRGEPQDTRGRSSDDRHSEIDSVEGCKHAARRGRPVRPVPRPHRGTSAN